MSKFLLIAIALLVISMMPSSLTSSNVLAQADEETTPATAPIFGKTCIHENMQYSLGDFIRVELGPRIYAVLRCLENSGEIQWIALTGSELRTSSPNNDSIFQETEQ
jgi:hypothetical protein